MPEIVQVEIEPTAPHSTARVPFPVRMRQARIREAKLRNKASAAYSAGDGGRFRFYRSQYWKSYDVRLALLWEQGSVLKSKKRQHILDERLLQVAEQTHLDQTPEEVIRVFPKVKPKGGFRPIQVPGQMRRAQMKMLHNMMVLEARFDERQFLPAGRGRQAACKHLVAQIFKGYTSAIDADIKNFFSSVYRTRLHTQLGIDRKLVERVVLSEGARLLPYEGVEYRPNACPGPHQLLESAQHGLMQGAPISSLVAETINSKIMACVPAEACLVNFADNYQALGRTRQEAELALKALKPAVERCPAGRFKLIHKKVRRLDHGIEFLGYRFKANRYGVSIKPAKAKEQEFYQKVRDLIRSSDSEVKKAAALKTLLMSWSSAYELCPSIEYDVMTTLRDRYAKRPHVWRLLRPGWTALCRRARARFERGAEILERQPTNFRSSVLTSK